MREGIGGGGRGELLRIHVCASGAEELVNSLYMRVRYGALSCHISSAQWFAIVYTEIEYLWFINQ